VPPEIGLRIGGAADLDVQRAALGHGVAGVDAQVHQHLQQLGRVAHHGQVLGDVGLEHDRPMQRPPKQALCIGDHVGQRDGLVPTLAAACKRQQLPGEVDRTASGCLDVIEGSLEHLLGDAVLLLKLLQVGGVGEHDAQQVVEIVRDPSRELPEGLKLLGLDPLVLEPVSVREQKHCARADRDLVAEVERRLGDALAVDERPIATAEVFDRVARRGAADPGVSP
jgi:hypothetical protein